MVKHLKRSKNKNELILFLLYILSIKICNDLYNLSFFKGYMIFVFQINCLYKSVEQGKKLSWKEFLCCSFKIIDYQIF